MGDVSAMSARNILAYPRQFGSEPARSVYSIAGRRQPIIDREERIEGDASCGRGFGVHSSSTVVRTMTTVIQGPYER
jgi:hypothetical protein